MTRTRQHDAQYRAITAGLADDEVRPEPGRTLPPGPANPTQPGARSMDDLRLEAVMRLFKREES